jgi:hypothetical protein
MQAGLRRCLGSVSAAAGPDEVVGFAAFVLDEAGVDRGREARIIQLDREIFAAGFAGGLLPGRAELGGAGEDPIVGAALAFAFGGDELGLDVEGQGLDRAGDVAVRVLVKVPMVAIVVSPFLGPRLSRPRWRS